VNYPFKEAIFLQSLDFVSGMY